MEKWSKNDNYVFFVPVFKEALESKIKDGKYQRDKDGMAYKIVKDKDGKEAYVGMTAEGDEIPLGNIIERDNKKVLELIESRLYSLGYILKDAEKKNLYDDSD